MVAFAFLITASYAQKEIEIDFYTFLQAQIKEAVNNQDSVIINEETKACFGSTWKAVLKPKNKYTTITFYVDRIAGTITDTSGNLFRIIADTSFTLQTMALLDNLDSEVTYLKNNLVISYTTTEYIIQQAGNKRKFKLEKGQGLYYWLRFNKSWTEYVADRQAMR